MSCSINAYQTNNMPSSGTPENQGMNTSNNTNNLFENLPNANQLFQQVTTILSNMINTLIANTVGTNPNPATKSSAASHQTHAAQADNTDNTRLSAVTNPNPSEQLHSVNPIHLAAQGTAAENQTGASSAALSMASPSANSDTPVSINPSHTLAMSVAPSQASAPNADSNISLSAAMPSVDNSITSVDPNHLIA